MTAAATTVTIELAALHDGQERVLHEARRFNVAMCGRRFGKTTLGEDIAANDALDGQLVGWWAPSYKFAEEAWIHLRAILSQVPGARIREQQRRLELPNGGLIEVWSLDGDEDAGRSRRYHKAVIDEAGLIPSLRRIFDATIRLTLADYRGGAWFLGTPKGIGDFSALYDLGQTKDPEWQSWRLPTHLNPYIPPDEIEAMRLTMPDPVFRQEVLAEPLDDGEHPIGRGHIAACVAPLSTEAPVCWGVDLARAVDWTVPLALDKNGHVCRLDRYRRPWGTVKSDLTAALTGTMAYVDSTGVGDPIVEDLQRAGCAMVGVVFTARVKQQMIEDLAAAIQQRKIKFPDGWLRAELDALTAERTATGTRYSAPDGLHDDGVMALALAYHGWRRMGFDTAKPPAVVRHSRDDVELAINRIRRDRAEPTSGYRAPRREGLIRG